jgi:phospholipase C
MRGFDPNRLPVLNALATQFAVCDHWFSSMPGPTWPNRFFVHAATSGGLDHSPSLPKEMASGVGDPYRFENGTIFDSLDSKGLDWAIYAGDAFPQALHMDGMDESFAEGKFHDFGTFDADVKAPGFSKSYVFIEPDWHPFTHFKCGNSQHPIDDVTRGERLLKKVYESVRNSPVWNRSMLIVTYDEHGGFYDHVPPPTVVGPGDKTLNDDNNKYGFDFEQLGVRVPAVVVSPYTKRGAIDHRVYEHSSVPATLEKLFGLPSLTQRDKGATSLDGLATLDAPRTDAPTQLPEPAVSGISCDADATIWGDVRPLLDEVAVKLRLKAPKPVDAALCGFVHVALQRKILNSGPGARAKIIQEASALDSEAKVLRYFRGIS